MRGNEQLYLIRGCQIINIEGIIALGNHHLTTAMLLIDLMKNHQWMLN